jgi:hypothetical protein
MAGFVEVDARMPVLRVAATDVSTRGADPEIAAGTAFLAGSCARGRVLARDVLTGCERERALESLQHEECFHGFSFV